MGKNNLILGTGRGKLGDIVFYRTGGEQRFRTRVRPTNPRTNAQLLQRCVVSTAVKLYSTVANICNHAFQNYEGSLKNHQRFMKLNIDYLRKVALKNVEKFDPIEFTKVKYGNWAWKNSSNIPINNLQLSEGDLPTVNAVATLTSGVNYLQLARFPSSGVNDVTYQDIINNLGLQQGDQITTILFRCDKETGTIESVKYGRTILSPANGNITTPFNESKNEENAGDVEIVIADEGDETGASVVIREVGKTVATTVGDIDTLAWCIITSRYENKKWRRSTSFITAESNLFNKGNLKDAMLSYSSDITSSLYLNQSNNGTVEDEFTNVKPRNEYIEEETIRKTKKSNKDAE